MSKGIFCRLATLVVGFKCSRNHSQPAAYFNQYSYFTLPCGNRKNNKRFLNYWPPVFVYVKTFVIIIPMHFQQKITALTVQQQADIDFKI
jgi:hypothetical protein